ncbi:MAG: FAD:protein FMN transferase [candidate division KSB1 bacterium]|nr:FAD:protein FMN transferase [candidate division KSB1 bacterium]MDZ7318528.1 FAD:protein FMN transferase [candidate division KSB1 bacterium]MDZ7342167.1 FAD:protein FMN transferase [candidate division KSB1 bacterium]
MEQTAFMMDTVVQIAIYDNDRPVPELEKIIQAAFARIKQIERITNDYDDSSSISLVNRVASVHPVTVDSELVTLIAVSERITQLSAGAFDITIGSVKRLWPFNAEHPSLPAPAAIRQALRAVGMRQIQLTGKAIKLANPDIRLDLGAIAKGYAVDEAIRVLQRHGISDAMVNAGGNLRTLSSDLTRGLRRVWIKHPRETHRFFGFFPMDAGCVATSGDYERYFVIDSVRYHHILDPTTGYPARGCVSVTVLAPSAMEADALSTALFVLGPQKGMALIEELPDIEGVIIFEHEGKLEWLVSAGLKEKFRTI